MISPGEVLARLKAIWRPGLYHGHGKTQSYFEGWYFKCVDASGRHPMAVIPGIFLGNDDEDSHSFVQVLYGLDGQSEYHRYAVDDFSADPDRVFVRVGDSEFSMESMRLRLDSDLVRSADVEFGDLTPWPSSFFSPGIMGPFGLVPRMQCYHGVLSMDHDVSGQIQAQGETIDLAGGRGYIEKDWGRGFPRAWTWLQCNHFDEAGTSLTLSVATVPWAFTAFRGFLVGLLHDGTIYPFTTYNRSTIEEFVIDGNSVRAVVSRGRLSLEVWAEAGSSGTLLSPEQEGMIARVSESMGGTVRVRLKRDTEVLYDGDGSPAAMEITGDVS